MEKSQCLARPCLEIERLLLFVRCNLMKNVEEFVYRNLSLEWWNRSQARPFQFCCPEKDNTSSFHYQVLFGS
ncbi:hypothetical protein KY290_010733 [Solanum tuberosum]|uniref:Uncharacterized protein n=1 Tax=Solanum tuberosum TaxID=4113 RepID=A0ABQ7VZV7_SOLTU|nr:hypothetical protein KY290_010733 [Solanum tuberosum]